MAAFGRLIKAVVLLLGAVVTAGQQTSPSPLLESPLLNQTINSLPAPGPELASSNSSCAFTYAGARYHQTIAEITLQSALDNIFINDALIRLLRPQLGVEQCQLSLSQGVNCTAGTQTLPCSDPIFSCSNGIVVSYDTYAAIMNGDCTNAATKATLVCETIIANPSLVTAVESGTCRPQCVSSTTPASTTHAIPVGCLSYTLTVDAPTKSAAMAVAAALASPALQTAVDVGLTNYSSGSGIQFLIVTSTVQPAVGFGFFPPPPPPLLPIEAPSNITLNSSASEVVASSVLVYGPWSNCTGPCKAGTAAVSIRSASCVSPDGTLLQLSQCPDASTAQTFQTCTASSCSAAQWEYSPWSICNATCGGGTASRKATCSSTDGTPCPSGPEATVQICNTNPCTSYFWTVSAWSACSAPCGGGNRTRTVACVNSAGKNVSSSNCHGENPPAVEKCNIQACDFCQNNPCLGRGTCSNGACSCTNGYSGSYCEIPASCSSGVVDTNLACCSSGLVDVNGTCCPTGARLDANGHCCSQKLDVCGVCGGNGLFIDMQGICCTVADAAGVCCPSGIVDECGVCDGLGNTCPIMLKSQVTVPASLIMGGSVQQDPLLAVFQSATSSLGLPPNAVIVTNVTTLPQTANAPAGRRRLVQQSLGNATIPMFVIVSINTTAVADNATVSNVPLNAAYLAAEITQAAQPTLGVQLQGQVQGSREGVCGNAICEIGERSTVGAEDGTCPKDCGLPAVVCVGGCGVGGNCLPAAGVCQCYVGYLGPNCVDCAPGYIKSGGVCVTSVTALHIVNASALRADGTAEDPSTAASGGTNAGLIAGCVIGGILGAILLVTLFCLIRRRLRRHYGAPGPVLTKFEGPPQGAIVAYAVDEEIGLRQKYGLPSARSSLGDGAVPPSGPYHVHVDVTGRGDTTARSNHSSYSNVDGWHSAREVPGVFRVAQQNGATRPGGGSSSSRSHTSMAELEAQLSPTEMNAQGEVLPTARSNASEGLNSARSRPLSARAAGLPPLPRLAKHGDDLRASLPSGSVLSASLSALSLNDASKTMSSVDTGAGDRLFFNPAFSVDGKPVDVNKSIAPGYAKPLSARDTAQQRVRPTMPLRPKSAGPPEAVAAQRRVKLDALRATVRSLEQQANDTRKAGPAPAQMLEEPKRIKRPVVPRLALPGSVVSAAAPGDVPLIHTSSGTAAGGLIKSHPGEGGSSRLRPPSASRLRRNEYADVMAKVDNALRSADSSPEKKPSARGAGEASRIPRLSSPQKAWR